MSCRKKEARKRKKEKNNHSTLYVGGEREGKKGVRARRENDEEVGGLRKSEKKGFKENSWKNFGNIPKLSS